MILNKLTIDQLEPINYCRSGSMSFCTAGNFLDRQKCCKYYRKASLVDRCMFFRAALDNHCDCIDAQRDVDTRTVKNA